jgi:hypothetical protein
MKRWRQWGNRRNGEEWASISKEADILRDLQDQVVSAWFGRWLSTFWNNPLLISSGYKFQPEAMGRRVL